jgi:spore maturation protein CgeB
MNNRETISTTRATNGPTPAAARVDARAAARPRMNELEGHAAPVRRRVVILGLSITSSWGNGHATTYRGLTRALVELGHEVTFLERDTEWYAANRDLPENAFGRTEIYSSLADLRERFTAVVRDADLVIVGSYVPEGIAIGEWVIATTHGVPAFYDIDTPVTLAALARGTCEYVSESLIARYALYLSFTGGPTLGRIERKYASPRARALYCAVDPSLYYPDPQEVRWDLGYMGTYSLDRQPALEQLMLSAARALPAARFVVAGPQYPQQLSWPGNVERIEHLPPTAHRTFYNAQRFTLNITRADMVRAGFSPSVRLFEAAACGTPIISDHWDGLETLFAPDEEILVSRSSEDTVRLLGGISEVDRLLIAERALTRVLQGHTPKHRARELMTYLKEVHGHSGGGP